MKIFEAYYYSFEATGDPGIDAVLEAVANAGKSYHHTEMWNEPSDFGDKKSEVEKIQDAANKAAAASVKYARILDNGKK